MGSKKPRVIYWFRTDLRLHDSPALAAALDLKPSALYPVWTWDPHYVYHAKVGPNRWQFLLDCQNDLSASITKLNKKSKLFLIREGPTTLLPKLFKEWDITHLVFEKDVDGYGRERDKEVAKLAKEAGVEIVSRSGRTLWDSDQIVERNGGPTMSMSQIEAAGKKVGEIARPIPAPKSLPDPGETSLSFEHEQPQGDPDLNAPDRNDKDKTYSKLAGPKGDFAVPTMEELSLKPATSPHRGGETRALKKLDEIIKDKDYTATFEKPKTAPTDFSPAGTTLLSAHMHFGSLSCREFYWRVRDVVDNYKGASQPPTSLTGQLLFRDMYFAVMASLGRKMGQTYSNPKVRFVPWHLPSKIDTSTGLIAAPDAYDIDSEEAEMWFQRWKHGRTGFPWIDALMRQLRQEGWIHHLGRHAVACFLTRGGCYVDWERGASVFAQWLIDHEPACNDGNWQWLSCTAFFAQFYRCYSPISFPQKWDKEGAFVRHYVPELAEFDKKYIYEPWKAPIADQEKWGCRVEGDGGAADGKLDEEIKGSKGLKNYPKPMFDFNERRQICLDGMKNAYDVKLYGDDKRVLDGSWRKLFEDDAEGPTKGKDGPPGAQIEDDDGTGEAAMSPHRSPRRGKKAKDSKDTGEEEMPSRPKRAHSQGQTKMDGHVKKSKK